MSRDKVVTITAWTSVLLAVASLALAFELRTTWSSYKQPWGYVLLGLWALGPPMWFMAEYSFLPPSEGHQNDRVKHLHDLARNLWLAFAVVLAVTMDIKLQT
jgi:hypothetical protein